MHRPGYSNLFIEKLKERLTDTFQYYEIIGANCMERPYVVKCEDFIELVIDDITGACEDSNFQLIND